MGALNQAEDPMGQILALASDCDPTTLSLTAAEGFLLSRVDGSTPWRLLREMGGIPAGEADACLTRWRDAGILVVVGGGSATPGPASAGGSDRSEASGQDAGTPTSDAGPPPVMDAAEAPRPEPVIDESALDGGLDIDLEVQRRILSFEASLTLPYHELLGVDPGTDPKSVKRAYFKLSKEFHPDRYFRREIGGYGDRLERIFKKVLEAHEILSDPELCGVENQPAAGAAGEDGSPAAATDAAVVEADASSGSTEQPATSEPVAETVVPQKPAKPRPLTKLERLKQRMPFKIDHGMIAARRAKAEEIFRAAELSERAGKLQEAEANIRIAISFDPLRAEFKEALGSLKIKSAGARASKLLAAPSDRMSDSELREARSLLEDVLIYRPHDPELNDRAAQICLRLGKLDEAAEYAETLIEGDPEAAEYHSLLGRICRESGDTNRAVREFELALKFDKDDMDARRGLAAVRIGHRDSVRGGGS